MFSLQYPVHAKVCFCQTYCKDNGKVSVTLSDVYQAIAEIHLNSLDLMIMSEQEFRSEVKTHQNVS